MDLNDTEVAMVLRCRQTPEQRRADDAARRAKQDAAMLARMTREQREAYAKRKATVDAMTPVQRTAEQFLRLQKKAAEQLARPAVAEQVEAVTNLLPELQPKPVPIK